MNFERFILRSDLAYFITDCGKIKGEKTNVYINEIENTIKLKVIKKKPYNIKINSINNSSETDVKLLAPEG